MNDNEKITINMLKRKPVRFRTLLLWAIRNLSFKKLRTSLTIAGVVIGIGAMVFLLSFGLGMRNLVSKQVIGNSSVNTIDVTSPKSSVLAIDRQALNQIKSIRNVDKVGETYSYVGDMSYQKSNTTLAVFAASQNYLELSSLRRQSGEVSNLKGNEAFLNTTAAKAIGFNNFDKAIGQTVHIKSEIESGSGQKNTINQDLKVKGIIQTSSGSEVMISDEMVKSYDPRSYNQIKVVANSQDKVPEIRKEIEALGFSTTSPLDTLSQINDVFRFFNIILIGFGGIGMVIAILGMFNTLTISLLERVGEISLLLSIGARSKDITTLFIFEALTLSLAGGVIGIAGAGLLGTIIDVVFNRLAASRGVSGHFSFFSMPFTLMIGALVFICLVGLSVVIYPAYRAARIDPIDVLHHD